MESETDDPNDTSVGPAVVSRSVERSPASGHHVCAVSPQRRSQIWQALRRAVPALASEKRRGLQERAQYATLCIQDAFQGRLSNGLANNSRKGVWVYSIFRLQTSRAMHNAVVAASLLHSFSLFFEPDNACPASLLFRLFQRAVLALYLADIALKMGYEGVREYFRHDWQQLYVLNLVLSLLDLCAHGCIVYTNPLRPLAGLLRARKGRKFFEVLKKMAPGMTHNLVPVLFFVVVIMSLSSLCFDAEVRSLSSVSSSFYNWWFLVLTNDTFDRLLPDSAWTTLRYLGFFFPALYVGQRFLLSLVIGDTYNTYKSFVKKQLRKERLKELQGLTKAFTALDEQQKGQISNLVWRECMAALSPELAPEAIALYYELISQGSERISILQFLSLRNILSFRLAVDRRSRWFVLYGNAKKRLLSLWEAIVLPFAVPPSVTQFAQSVLHVCEEWSLFYFLSLCDVFVLCSGYSDTMISLSSLLPFTFCEVVSLVLCVECALRVCAAEGSLARALGAPSLSKFILFVGCVGALCVRTGAGLSPVILRFLSSYFPSIPLPYLSVHKVALSLRLLRCTRVATLSQDLQDFNAALYDVIPALVETFSFTFVVSYVFGTLGSLLFGAHMPEWRTPLLGVVKAQQLTFMVGFLDSMENAVESVHPLATLYFLSFLVLSLTVSNIALSIIIDLHAAVLENNQSSQREGQQRKIDLVFDKLVSQARARSWARHQSHNATLNFTHIRLSEFQSSDVRHFIIDAQQEMALSEADLVQCQKYAKIDLVKFFREQHRHHKDLHWEVDFLKSLHDQDALKTCKFAPGETVFLADDPAKQLFLLTKGSVKIVKPGGETSLFYPTYFLGAESLLPRGRYTYTCIAVGEDTEFSVFDQDAIAHLDTEVSGGVLKMLLKSSSQMEVAFFEARKGNRRFSVMRQGSSSAFANCSTPPKI